MKKPKKLPVAVTEEEYIKLIKVTKEEHHKLAFMLAYEAGMRISEVLKLEQRDVLKDQMIVRQGKGSKDRIVPKPKNLKTKFLSLLPISQKYSSYSSGSRALQIVFKNSAKSSGLLDNKPEAHFHSLRHGFATRCIEKGMPIHHVKQLLGHSSISTTNVYLVANPKDSLKSYEELF